MAKESLLPSGQSFPETPAHAYPESLLSRSNQVQINHSSGWSSREGLGRSCPEGFPKGAEGEPKLRLADGTRVGEVLGKAVEARALGIR